ncbi:MAG: SH3 domain-containing protein [Saprospirales bacterium]|nr:SH3 domain-containing protein [Saprospirales bacterium]MBK8492652.1 SH3 domain-containing protein [Saprospirales bacterium]
MSPNTHFYKFFFYPLLSVCLLAIGCGSDPNEDTVSTDMVAPAPAQRITLISNLDYLRIRKTPGVDGEVITTLSEGDTLYEMGEVSAFTTEVTLRGIRFNEPWIKVRTQDSLSGWVYGGGVNFQLDDRLELTNRLMKMRLQTFFGEILAQRILDYRAAYRQAKTSTDLAAVYREAGQLRDTLVQIFDKKITVIQKPDQTPNIAWMEEAMPGMITQRVAEGTAFYLFMDYHQWLARSRQTTGSEDNQFAEVCLTAFHLDSIEYFAPDWLIQTSDVDFYSELGKGVHQKMLEKMNQARAASDLFEPEYQEFKSKLLADITGMDDLAYWNDQLAILGELDAILAAEYGILTNAEKASIQTRRQQFEQPDIHHIRLNVRAGVELK